ncbi:MAG: LacI family DNA-binding transcriptional regulator [Chloroflexota bacterium]
MKRPTQVDVARLAGVSRATVSYVVNGLTDGRVPISEETRQRVLAAVEDLGYVPDARAQSLRSGDTHTIGLIVPDVRNPHFWEHAEGVEQEARASGYNLLLSSIALNSQYAEEIFRNLSRRRIDGLILMGSIIDTSQEAKKIFAWLHKRRLPIVEISDRNVDYDVDLVMSDYRVATQEVMTYLLSLKHRRIGMIYGVSSPVLAEDRLLPYQEGLQANNLPVDQELIAKCGPTIEDGYQAALQLLKLPARPTALIAINDLLAIGALRAAADLGLHIPADLSLVGFDGVHMSNYLVPRLTTVVKDSIGVGREAVKQLLTRINNPNLPRQKTSIPPHLIVRESTGPASH